MRLYVAIGLFFFLIIALGGCTKNRVFEKNEAISKSGWAYGESLPFKVEISDTSAAYNLYLNIRHTDGYGFNNIWIAIRTIFPDSSSVYDKINVQLSTADGVWTGNCINSICYNSVLVQPRIKFIMPGRYTFLLEQDMRVNPLLNILNVGVKIELL